MQVEADDDLGVLDEGDRGGVAVRTKRQGRSMKVTVLAFAVLGVAAMHTPLSDDAPNTVYE